jgi:pimeloyl-ACP methyl ester carboxylesterase
VSSQLDLGAARRADSSGRYGTLGALTAGEPLAGDVLLVPGYTGSKEDFGPILDRLAGAGLRATAIDLPGQLDSAGPDEADAYRTEELAIDVLDVVARMTPPVHLVGHSFGGLVCRAAVLAKPAAVADLVLMCSGPSALGGLRGERIATLAPVLPQLGLAGVWDAMQAVYAAEPGYEPPSPELGAFLRRRFFCGREAMLAGMGQALTGEPDRVDALAACGVRTLVMHGAGDDAWLPADQRAMAHRLGAAYAVVPGAAHSPAVENPSATVGALLDFWAG